MQHEVGRGHRQHHASHAADGEGQHEGDRPHHGKIITDAAAVHGEQPVEQLGAGGDRDHHGGDAEEAVDGCARAHGEEVVQPHDIGQDADDGGGVDHRRIAKQALGTEGRGDFREHAEDRQDEDVDLGMAPDPDQVDIEHRRAAEVIGEEVGVEGAVKAQERQHHGQHREDGDDQNVGDERRPGEDWHLHQVHAGGTKLEDRGDEVDARKRRADTGNLQAPDIVIGPDVRAVGQPREWRIG